MNIPFSGKYRIGTTRLLNPIVIASCPATEDFERLLRCAEAGAAAAILKSCPTAGSFLRNGGNRRFQSTSRGLWGTSTIDRELLHLDKAISIHENIGKRSEIVVIPSVAGFTLEPDEWIYTLRVLEACNPAYVQLDLYYLREDLSLPITQQRLRTLINTLGQECNHKLLPKLNQELRPGAAIEVFRDTMICGWSLLDSLRNHLPNGESLSKPDFPNFDFATGLDSASLFGSWQLPLVCEYVSRLRTETSLSILAGGGVTNAIDIARLLSLGADAVQVATAIITEGTRWIKGTLSDLNDFCDREVERSISSPTFTRTRINVDKLLCLSCGRCAEQLMCNAIQMSEEGPLISSELCEGCGFCVGICPIQALSLSAVLTNNSTTHVIGGLK